MNSYKEDNRRRLIKLLDQIEVNQAPDGWAHVVGMAVGGLEAVGFSQQGPYLLVVSSAGRSVVHCDSGKKIARDYEANAGFTESGLHCRGIGVISEEIISLGGIHGGGLPLANSAGETLVVAAPEWPESLLILTKPCKTPFVDGHQADCNVIYAGYLSAYGFSWCGNYIVAACGSDLDLWSRETAL